MHIGVDFDNTIVCYDGLFHKVAREKNLIPAEVPVNKSDVRNYLRRVNNEPAWTEMQGCVYGPRLTEAAPYPGVIEFFQSCRTAGIRVSIVSHKTKHPFLGEKHDLHAAAQNWLEHQGFFDPARIGLAREQVFLELTKQAKIDRIAALDCTHFVDDLPEFLAEPSFPAAAHRILFDPNRNYEGERAFTRLESWADITRFFELRRAAPDSNATESEACRSFLAGCGLAGEVELRPLLEGGNNRVFRVHHASGEFVLKSYFHNPADLRDRFGAERAFYELLWSQGIRRTPEPRGWSAAQRLGLFTLVPGRKLSPAEVDANRVREAIEFIGEINAVRPVPAAQGLRPASEACFTLAQHLATVERRVERLAEMVPEGELAAEAAAFVNDNLKPAWARVRQRIAGGHEEDLDRELPGAARCLSPSDFGFHNALLAADGRLRFIDFEYAGWDDPAKLVCDFFCQPELSVDVRHWDAVVGPLDRLFGPAAALPVRAARLLPAYQIKWCCILLNEFIRVDAARRRFAAGGEVAGRRARQLAKARTLLDRVAVTGA
jgi:Ser/Thr protein kinase RdoA (MazF antagonist)